MSHILIADDHAMFRRGICDLLREHFPAVEVEEVDNGTDMVTRAGKRPWDLFIMDITMPGRSGIDLLEDLLHVRPSTPVLVFSVYPESTHAIRMLRSGARGYLNKATSLDELMNAVRTLLAGKRYITPRVAESLVESIQDGPPKALHECLSNREFQVLPMLAVGMRLKEVAGKLGLSTNTVSTYRRRVLEKLGIKNNAELTRYVVEHCLIDKDGARERLH